MPVPNNATGLWPSASLGETPRFCSGVRGRVRISRGDRVVLRALAEKVRELCFRDFEAEKRQLWDSHNALMPQRPLILADPENGWNEIIPTSALKCRGELARRWEFVLRREIFCGESLKDDRPIEPVFEIGHTYRESGWGVEEVYHGGSGGRSYIWEAAIRAPEDIEKLEAPMLEVDQQTTLGTLALAEEVLGDILRVCIRGVWWWSLGMTLSLSKLVGLENLFLYFYDNPRLLHRLMAFLRDTTLARLDYLEENRLLSLNNNHSYVGSGGLGYSRELPRETVNQEKQSEPSGVMTSDLWGFTESQETIGVSAGMFEEFVFRYQQPIQARFGLNCYGCCEPLDGRWNVVRKTPNLRRVSVSPWADQEKMASFLEDRYIFSRKPSPSALAVPRLNEEAVRRDIEETLEMTRGCVVELIMKDNHTLGHNPGNLINWVRVAREEVDRLYG